MLAFTRRSAAAMRQAAATSERPAEIIVSRPQPPSLAGCSGALPRRACHKGFVSLPELRDGLLRAVTLPVRTQQP
jgi:hypothetical protein